ncbi:ATP-dependent Clp protease ATP-binding subunit [Escherichia coli]|uniref:ATP-dependent Clp protease ATP-binding subunit n=1 Tax=Escherichia coli TaxID=562 RepID=A0A377DJF2_ECOLX|nr:ATP-dependent Clp protease ATP-binding subunit [Escherichia coli]
MLNQELELSLNMAFARAREHRHEFMTVEHLLLALLSNPSAREALEACFCGFGCAPSGTGSLY